MGEGTQKGCAGAAAIMLLAMAQMQESLLQVCNTWPPMHQPARPHQPAHLEPRQLLARRVQVALRFHALRLHPLVLIRQLVRVRRAALTLTVQVVLQLRGGSGGARICVCGV